MSARDISIAILVAFIWALNFVVIKIGVADVPPLLLTGLRFFFAAVPAALFLPRPRAPLRIVVAYGLILGVAQFGLLFTAIARGMPAGLASLVMQTQVLFTIAISWLILGERPTRAQISGSLVAFLGIATIGGERFLHAGATPFLLTLAGAAAWGAANVIGKQAGKIDMAGFVAWASLAAPVPLFLLSFAIEGPHAWAALAPPSWRLLAVVAFLAWAATNVGFGLWARLLSRYPAALVTPFSFLVPVFGFVAAWFAFGEPIVLTEAIGGVLIMSGLVWSLFGERLAPAPPA